MAKPSQNALQLTLTELEWMQRMVPRHSTHIQLMHKNEPKNVTRRFANATEDFADKLATMKFDVNDAGVYTFFTNRQDLRILQKIVESEHTVTITSILPGYAEKMALDDKFTTYYNRTVLRANMLCALLNKIKARIS